MKPKIYFCGEALIDFITTDGNSYRATPGGAPYSSAKAAAQAGANVSFCGAISTDLFGQQIAADLAQFNVDISIAPRSDDPTVLGFVKVTADENPQYAFFDQNSAMVRMQPSLPDNTLRQGDILGIGSISLIPLPAAERIETFAVEQSETATLALDPNVRPSMIRGHPDWGPRMTNLMRYSDLIKISAEDLEFMAPNLDREEFARQRLKEGTGLVIVTDGSNGASAWSRLGKASVDGRTASGGDTVGAGDTLMGFSLAWLAEHSLTRKSDIANLEISALQSMLEFANAAAAMNCETIGCNPPSRRAVEQRLAQINH